MTLLEVTGLEAGYNAGQVLFGIDLAVERGEVVALMGRNGMGKTTTVKAIMGLIKSTSGKIMFSGNNQTGNPPYKLGQAGIGLVPEGRMIFPTLTIEENLISVSNPRGPWVLSSVYKLFPVLKDRRRNLGTQLSGGEQQMLAIGRALMTNPQLLILDEATEGLAPLIRAEIWTTLAHLKSQGIAVLVIDKNLDEISKIADRHYIIEKGEIAWQGTNDELLNDTGLVERFLHI
jgi:branched-chain amino acid transport system ATP-binding protein